MNSKQSIEATVIDTNHQLRGQMDIQVEFHQNLPVEVIHDGKTYNIVTVIDVRSEHRELVLMCKASG